MYDGSLTRNTECITFYTLPHCGAVNQVSVNRKYTQPVKIEHFDKEHFTKILIKYIRDFI